MIPFLVSEGDFWCALQLIKMHLYSYFVYKDSYFVSGILAGALKG